jgi:hypothetical protein
LGVVVRGGERLRSICTQTKKHTRASNAPVEEAQRLPLNVAAPALGVVGRARQHAAKRARVEERPPLKVDQKLVAHRLAKAARAQVGGERRRRKRHGWRRKALIADERLDVARGERPKVGARLCGFVWRLHPYF